MIFFLGVEEGDNNYPWIDNMGGCGCKHVYVCVGVCVWMYSNMLGRYSHALASVQLESSKLQVGRPKSVLKFVIVNKIISMIWPNLTIHDYVLLIYVTYNFFY